MQYPYVNVLKNYHVIDAESNQLVELELVS